MPTFILNVIVDNAAANQPTISNFNAFSQNVTVGSTGSSSSATLLSILAGGTLTGTTNATIGDGSGSTGAVLISGTNSLWSMGVLAVGNQGTGSFTVANGGKLDAYSTDANGNAITLGAQSGSSGSATVDNAQLLLDSGGLLIGSTGNGSLTVVNGGNLAITTANNAGYGMVLAFQSGSHGNATISGTNTLASIAGALVIGNVGTGNMSVANGASFTVVGKDGSSNAVILGYSSGSSGNLTVDGTNTIFNALQGVLEVGYNGNGNLTVSNGATLNTGHDGSNYKGAVIGAGSGSTGNATVTGANSVLNVGSQGNGALIVGSAGNGNLTISNGGTVSISAADPQGFSMRVGTAHSANVTIQDAASNLTATGKLLVSNGTFLVLDGNVTLSDALFLANGSTNATFHQSGGTVTIGGLAPVTVGNSSSGATGFYQMDGGTLNLNYGMNLGASSGSGTGNFTQTGGNVTAAQFLDFGPFGSANGIGIYNISGGNFTSTGGVVIGDTGHGTLTISNTGVFNAGSGSPLRVGFASGGTGTVNVNGGTLQVIGFTHGGAGGGTINMNGGTIQSTSDNSDFMSGFTNGNLVIQNGGAIIDANSYNITIAANLVDGTGGAGTGGLTANDSIGTGNLTLSGNNTYKGDTTVVSGILALSGNNQGLTGNVVVNGGTLAINNATALSTGQLNINGGNIDNTSGDPVTVSTGNTINLNADLYFVGSNDLNVGTGTVYLNAGVVNFTINAGNLTVGGAVNDNGNGNDFNKLGAGNLVMTGTGSTYLGQTNVQAGNLVIAVNEALPTNTIVSLGDGNDGTANLVLGNSSSGAVTQTVAGLSINGTGIGSSIIGGNYCISTLRVFVPGSSPTEYDGLIGTGNGFVCYTPENAIGLEVRTGSDSNLFLTGNSTYLGGTQLDTGTLAISQGTSLGADTGNSSTGLVLGNGTSAIAILEGANVPSQDTTEIDTNRWITLNSSNTSSAIQVDDGVTLILGADSALLNGGSSAFALNKTGNGTLQLAGDSSNYTYANCTYAAATNIIAGTLQLGADYMVPKFSDVTVSSPATFDLNGYTDTISTLSGAGNVTLGDGLLKTGRGGFETTFSGIFSGTGSVSKYGSANFNLSGESTFSGNFNIYCGTLTVLDTLALQNAIVNDDATLVFDSSITTATFGALAGTSDIALQNSDTTSLDLTVGNFDQSGTYYGNLSGPGNLTKVGSGTQVLNGNSTYAGLTTISNGALVFGGDTSGLSNDTVNNADLYFSQTADSAYYGNISGIGNVTQNGSANLTLYGTSNYTGNTSVSTGTLTVDGSEEGGVISATDQLSIALVCGEYGYMVLQNGASLTANTGSIGSHSGAHGYLTVDNSSALFNQSLIVGDSGKGFLTIQNGGSVEVAGSFAEDGGYSIGLDVGYVKFGKLIVTGDGSSVTLDATAGALNVGDFAAAKLSILAGASITVNGGSYDPDINGIVSTYIGGASFGGVIVSDVGETNSTLTVNNGSIVVGDYGYGKLQILNGGVVNANGNDQIAGEAIYVGQLSGYTGNVYVANAGSILNITNGGMIVGANGTGYMTIANGGVVYSNSTDGAGIAAIIGDGRLNRGGFAPQADPGNGDGTVTVTDPGSIWNINNGILVVGNYSNGTLNIFNGGVVNSNSNDSQNSAYLGYQVGSNGNIVVDGAGSTWNINSGSVAIGYYGLGNLTIQNGGTVNSITNSGSNISIYVGQGDEGGSGTGNITVTDTSSILSVSNGAVIVGHGGQGYLNIYNGGLVSITGTDTGDSTGVSLYVGVNSPAEVTSSVVVSGNYQDANSTLNTNGVVIVGSNANGELDVNAGGVANIYGADSGNVGLYIGHNNGTSGTVNVDGSGSNLTLVNGSVIVGFDGNGALSITNSGAVNFNGTDSKGIGFYVGRHSDSTGTVTVDGSSLNIAGGATAVGYRGLGSLTVSNGGYVTSSSTDSNFIGAYIGSHGSADGSNVTVTGGDSGWEVDNGALVVGSHASAALNILNGGSVYTDGSDLSSIALYIGYHGDSSSNVTVSDHNSELDISGGALVAGLWGTGNLSILNGGYVNSESSDGETAVYLGYHTPSTGNALVDGLNSEWDISGGSAIIGRSGFGNLTIQNGGNVNITGMDESNISLYLGYNGNGTGNLTITDALPPNDIVQYVSSQLLVSNGAVIVGYGNVGNLQIANGGYANLSGNDGSEGSSNVALYLGYNEGSTGNVLVTGVEPISGFVSELDTYNGAIVVGFNGLGNLTVANGGYVNSNGSDGSVGLYIGENSGAAGSSVTVTGVATLDQNYKSFFYVGGGATIVGYNGAGNLTIANGGYFQADANDGTAAMYVGSQNGVTGTVSIDGSNGDYASELEVSGGALYLGADGTGIMTVTNGGFLNANSSDNRGIGLYIGRHSDGTGSLSVDGANSEADITDGALAVGYRGTGSLSITNGGSVYAESSSNNYLGAVIGWHGSATNANMTVSDYNSYFEISGGALVVGNWGAGNLTVANAANVTASSYDDNTGVGMYIGRGANGSGNVTVSDVYENSTAERPYIQSSTLIVSGGSLVVGYSGTGNLAIQNGGQVYASNSDNNYFGAAIGYNSGSTGNVTVNDVNTPQGDFDGVQSSLIVNGGPLVVGYYGNATLTVSNGGFVGAYSSDDNGVGAYLGYYTDGLSSTSVTNITGVEPNSNWQSEFDISEGSLVVGYNGVGTLNVTSGGYVDSYGSDNSNYGVVIGSHSDSSGYVTVDGLDSLTGRRSEMDVEEGALVVGKCGAGTLMVSSGGLVYVDGADSEGGNGLYIAKNGDDSSVTVTGWAFGNEEQVFSPQQQGVIVRSELNVDYGAMIVGNYANGTLSVTNGGLASISGSDSNGIGAYLGYGNGYNGTVNVDGQDTSIQPGFVTAGQISSPKSELDVTNGSLVVGYDGNGILNITNGALVVASGLNDRNASLYLGRESDGTGTVLIDGMGSNLDVENGSAVVGSYGTGYLTIQNGGSLTANGTDSRGYGFYIGSHGSSEGSFVTISDSSSTMTVSNGALVVGYRGQGDLNVVNGGYLNANGYDNTDNYFGLILGRHGDASGNLYVSDFGSSADIGNTAVVGYWGSGNVTVVNGGLITLYGYDNNGVGAYLGYKSDGTGNLTITGTGNGGAPGEDTSGVIVNNGSLVVGYKGSGYLTVSNGGTLIVDGNDTNNVGLSIANRWDSYGSANITDVNSYLAVTNGSTVVGRKGEAYLSIANGAVANLTGYDSNDVSLLLGDHHSGYGNVTVDGLGTTLNIGGNREGIAVIGNNGTGILTVTNGGNVTVNGHDNSLEGDAEYSMIIGQNLCSNGTLLIDGSGSLFTITNGQYTTGVGVSGTGVITITNGGTFLSTGFDDTLSVGMYLGQNSGAAGNVSVDGADGNGTASSLTLTGGSMVVGFSGNGNLNVTNGGYVSVQTSDNNGNSLVVGYNSNSNGNVTVDGSGSHLDLTVPQNQNNFSPAIPVLVGSGLMIVGESGSGNVTITNNGLITSPSGVLLADQLGSSANFSIFTGGTLEVGNIFNAGQGTYNVYMSGGTIRVVGSDLFSNVYIQDDEGLINYIDTNGFNATFSGSIAGDDLFVKIGLGTLTYTNSENNTYNGTTVSAGSLVVENGTLSNATANITVAGNARDVANLTVQNGGVINALDLLIGTHYKSNATVVIDGNNSSVSLAGNLTLGGYRSHSNLTIQNGGSLLVSAVDGSGNDVATIDADGRHGHADMTVTGTDGFGLSSLFTVQNGSLVVGDDGRGRLTVSNGGLVIANGADDNGFGVYLGYNSGSYGKVEITDNNSGTPSELRVTNGGLVVGYDGTGKLDIENGGLANITSGNFAIGYNADGNGTVTVSDDGSALITSGGALSVGLNGSGYLNVLNGASVTLSTVDCNNIALYIGHYSGSYGCVTVDGVSESGNASLLTSTGGVVVGKNSNGDFNITNGGIANITGSDCNLVALYVGYACGVYGNVTVDGVNTPIDESYVSQLNVTNGAAVVGHHGIGTLNITNGGSVSVNFADDSGIGLYVGEKSDGSGTVSIDGYDPYTEDYSSALTVTNGALSIGHYGSGNVTVTNGGQLSAGGSDYHEVALYLGRHSGSSGNLTVDNSYLGVSNGSLAVGFRSSGNLSIVNGTYAEAYGYDSNGFAAILGYHGDGVGNVTVDNAEFDIYNGSLVVGLRGTGNLTIQNGGYVDAYGSDENNYTAYIGYHGSATANVTVTDINSELEIDNSILAIGYNGTGTLTIVNGGNVTALGRDENGLSVLLGAYACSSNGIVNIDGSGSVFNIGIQSFINAPTGGSLVVGYNGTGNLTVTNGGAVNAAGQDDNGFGAVLGYNSGATGNLTVDNSTLTVGYLQQNGPNTFPHGGSLEVGYNGTGNLTIQNGGTLNAYGFNDFNDYNGYAVVVGDTFGSNGTLTVDGSNTVMNVGIQSISAPIFVPAAFIGSGSLVVGNSGTGTMSVTNGGSVNVYGRDFNGNAVVLGYNTDIVNGSATGNLTVDGDGSSLNILGGAAPIAFVPSFPNSQPGKLVVGYDGNGTLDISNGGLVNAGGGVELAWDDVNSYGNINITNGGILATGGIDGLAAGNDNYSFFMADGTLRVIVSDLTSSINITTSCVGLTDSFDTNGFNATLSGIISGSDNIQKIGDGNLTFANSMTYTGNTIVRDGTLIVDGGLGGYLEQGSDLIVGQQRHDHASFMAVNGTEIDINRLIVGDDRHSHGDVTVDNSSIYASTLTIGEHGHGNLTVANGGYVNANDTDWAGYSLDIGVSRHGRGNVTITDTDSVLSTDYAIAVGLYGHGNLTIANGGNLSDGSDLIIGVYGPSEGTVTVTDSNTILGMENGLLYIGYNGTGNLMVANGGTVSSDVTSGGIAAYIGDHSGSTGTATVDGSGSVWNMGNGTLNVGQSGNGSLVITNGGAVNVINNGNATDGLIIGADSTGIGNVTVDGFPSVLTIGNTTGSQGATTVGQLGAGYLTISNGGVANLDGFSYAGYSLDLAALPGSTGNVTVDGKGSQLNTVAAIVIGNQGTGSLTISNGGHASINQDPNNYSPDYGYGLSVGAVFPSPVAGSGTLVVTDDHSHLDVNGSLVVSNGSVDIEDGRIKITNGDLDIARAGNATFTQNGGRVEFSGDEAALIIGAGQDVTGIYDLNGGKLSVDSAVTIYVGFAQGTGVLNINGGKLSDHSSSDLYVGYYGGTGTLNINGGYLNTHDTNVVVTIGGSSNGTVNLIDGTLATLGIINEGDVETSTVALNFNGGVLRANGDNTDFISSFSDGEALIKSGGAFIDSNGYNITINTDLAGQGALTKLGDGNLTMTGTNTYSQGTYIEAGTLIVDGVNNGEIVHSNANTTVAVNDGDTASLIIQNSGAILDKYGFIANSLNTVGTVLVTDQGSFWHSANDLTVGVLGTGSLIIANGGLVSNANGTISQMAGGTGSSSVSVDGAGSQWKNGLLLTVAENYNGTLSITNGGLVSSAAGDIGTYFGATGSVSVDGEGSEWAVNSTLYIGDAGNGTLTITNAGNVTQKTGGDAIIGNVNGSNGTVLVTDTALDATPSTWNVGGNLYVGVDGMASLTIVNGGFVKAGIVTLAQYEDASGALELDTNGTLSLNQLTAGDGLASFTFNGGVLQARQNTTDFITNINTVTLGSLGGTVDTQHFDVTVNSLINGGGNLTKAGNGKLTLSNANTFTGDTMITGGTLILTNSLALQNSTLDYLLGGGRIDFSTLTTATLGGLSGDRDLNLSNNISQAVNLLVGNNGNDTVYSGNLTDNTHLGGNLTKIGTGYLTLTGTSTFGGGTTVTNGFINFNSNASLGTGNVTLQGGGLQWAEETSTDISSRLFLNEGIDTLDTNGNDVLFAHGLSGEGTLVKTGAGTLALSGCNTYTGDTYISQGTLSVDGLNNSASLTGSSRIFVGASVNDPSLNVVNGGNVSTCLLAIGVDGYGSVLVSGTDSSLSTTKLIIGDGACGNLTISSGGLVSGDSGVIGKYSSGSLTVKGDNSALTLTGELDVGKHGNDGTLSISCNATASIGGLDLANGSCSTASVSINSGGTLAVDGAGGLFAGCGSYTFTIGNGTLQFFGADLASSNVDMTLSSCSTAIFDTNSVNATLSGLLSGGGLLQKIGDGVLTLTNEETYTGGTNVLGGTLVIDGGSINHPSADLYVDGGNFTVQNGGSATVNNTTVDSSGASVLVADTDSTLSTQNLVVGSTGTASFTIANGGNVTATGGITGATGTDAYSVYVGQNAESNGTLTVMDEFSQLTVTNGSIMVGYNGTGTVAVQNGGVINSQGYNVGNDSVFVGFGSDSNGTVTVDGEGSQLNISGGALIAGYGGNASLTISNGGYANITAPDINGVSAYIGTTSDAMAEVTGSGSKLRVANGLLVLGEVAMGNLAVDNGGTVSSHGTILGDSVGSNGNLLISDGGSHYNAYTNAVIVGNHGDGDLTISNGGEYKSYGTDESNVAMYVANQSESISTVNVNSGGMLKLRAGALVVGNNGNGTVNVDSGGYVGISSGNVLQLGANDGSFGTFNLNDGGTLSVGGTDGIQSGGGSYAFNFGGGTLHVHSADLTTSLDLGLVDSTSSTIDTNGHNAVFSGALSGTGSFTKTGAGTLTLNSNNNSATSTSVTGGNLVVNGQLTSPVTVTNEGSILGGSGTVAGDLTLTNSGVVSPGIANDVTGNVANSLSTLTVTGNLAWNATASTIPWHLSSTNNSSDLLNVLGAVTNTNLGTGPLLVNSPNVSAETLLFDFQGTGFFDGNPADDTYTLITSSNDMSNAGFSISQFAAENVAAGVYGATAQSYFIFANGGTALEFVTVPEPSTWGLIAGGAMLALAGLRRKRKIVKA